MFVTKNSSRVVAFVSVLAILCLSIAFYYRDTSVLVSKGELDQILNGTSGVVVLLDDDFAFFHINDKIYRIRKDSVALSNLGIDAVISPKYNFGSVVFYSFLISLFCLSLSMPIMILVSRIGWSFASNPKSGSSRTTRDFLPTSSLKSNDDLDLSDFGASCLYTKSNLTFNDVAGIDEVKEELLEVIDYLQNPKKYQDLGIRLPKGILLVGLPGVGKTMIAKAVAGEARVPFFYQSGSSFVQIYVGMGAKRVRSLFAKAKAKAPSIVFIDEIDAVGKARGNNRNDEREATLNELLTEMDGFEESSGVIVMAATNNIGVLDQALLRSGRFDRRIYVDLPNVSEREDILRVYLNKKQYDLDVSEVARMCVGFSGASLALLVNEAALNALRHGRKILTIQDISESMERVVYGKKRRCVLDEGRKMALAVYNAGKAISMYWLDNEFQKISLISENAVSTVVGDSSRSEILNRIKICLSGGLALSAHGMELHTTAKDDIANAKYLARQMCETYGMAGRLITDGTDVLSILDTAASEHTEFISNSKQKIMDLAIELVDKEKLSRDEVGRIINA